MKRRLIDLPAFDRRLIDFFGKNYKFEILYAKHHFKDKCHCVNMKLKQGKTCPICQKEQLFYLSDHLRQAHNLSSDERKPWLKAAIFSPTQNFPFHPSYPFFGMSQYPGSMSSQIPNILPQSRIPKQPKTDKTPSTNCLETQTYPEFKFQHMFSMLVVGPSQCGKTYFVQQLLTNKCIDYPEKKPLQVYWFYNQWQPRYDEIQQVLKKKIRFSQGLPELSEDLHEIKPVHNNILVFDDLMAQAVDSPVLSRLFTQGRHRNASTILLLQNMFPKGKFNTDISRNALYEVLFRSPGDRKQIDIAGERAFGKDRANFMKAYTRETDKPFGYIILDNRSQASNEHQVVANVFGGCYTYPYITKTTSQTVQNKNSLQNSISLEEKPKLAVKRKTESQSITAKKQKRNVESQTTVVQKQKQQVKHTRPAVKKQKKLSVKRKPVKKQRRKQTGYHPEERFMDGFQEEESNEHKSNLRPLTFEEELNENARQAAENPNRRFRIR